MNLEPPDPPKTQTEAAGDGIGKPPRPTAVATGGPDDDGDNVPRRFDLDNPRSIVNAGTLGSWTVPELSFARLRYSQAAHETKGMDHVLRRLHGQYANLAFLLLGNKRGIDCLMGLSAPLATESGADEFTYAGASQQFFHQNVGDHAKVDDTLLDSETIKATIKQVSSVVGCMTGVPSLRGTSGEVAAWSHLDQLQSGMRGLDFGFAVLTAPIPAARVALEEIALLALLQKSTSSEDHAAQSRARHRSRNAGNFLQRLQCGGYDDFWQTGIYYFAPDRGTFVRLQSLLRAIYLDVRLDPPLNFHLMDNLSRHVRKFGMLLERGSREEMPSLNSYKYLTPLESKALSAFCDATAQE